MASVNKKQANADEPMFITSISHTFVISNEALEHILKRTIVVKVIFAETTNFFIEELVATSFFRRRSFKYEVMPSH